MARKLPGLQRVLDAPALFSVAYGEIASSIYFALGIIALHALGLTPRGAARRPACSSSSSRSRTPRGPPRSRRRAAPRRSSAARSTTSPASCTGWVLFLDYLIVIALSRALPAALPRRGARLRRRCEQQPVGRGRRRVVVIAAIAAVRLVRRPGLYTAGIVVAVLDLADAAAPRRARLRAALLAGRAHARRLDSARHPTWHELAFALPLAMLAYTGLETVANLAEETRRAGRDAAAQPLRRDRRRRRSSTSRSPSSGSAAFPVRGRRRPRSGRAGCARRCRDRRTRSSGASARRRSRDVLRVFVGLIGRAHPARRGDDVDLRVRAPRLLARRARPCCRARSGGSSGARSSRPGDRSRRSSSSTAIVDRVTVVGRRRGRVPREPLQLRRAARVHGRAARGDPPALHRARAARGPFRVPWNVRIARRGRAGPGGRRRRR